MLTERKVGKPRQSWSRRLWPFSAVRADRTENPRVGGSTPSQATTLQRLTGVLLLALALHLQLAAAAIAQERPDPWGPPASETPAARGRLRAAAIDAAWIGGAAALDLWSTDHAFGRCPTCYEGHPLMRGGLPARVGVKLAMTGVGIVWADHLRRKGDRRGARLVRWGLVGLQVGFTAWNLRQGR